MVSGDAVALDDDENPVSSSTIYIKMADENKNPKSRSLTAVFHPCIHCGWPTSTGHPEEEWGSLKGDLPLTDDGAEDGYDLVGSGFYGCIEYIHKKLRSIGQSWHGLHSDRDMGLTGISVQGGGYNGKSKSHRNGLDVDVRYVRTDGEGPMNFDTQAAFYDQAATQELVNLFIGQGATDIYVDEENRSGLTGSGVQMLREGNAHRDHFHVRFPDPDGVPPANCPPCPQDCHAQS